MKLVRWVQRIARIDIRFAVTRAGGDPRYIKRSLGVTWMQWIARDCTEVGGIASHNRWWRFCAA